MSDDIDSPEMVAKHRQTIQGKAFLKHVYRDFYGKMINALPVRVRSGLVVELGSGGGFLKELLPNVMTSDVVAAPGIDKVFLAQQMPFPDESMDAIVMLNCFHHFNDAQKTLEEFTRVLKAGGVVVMVEPANTWLRRLIDRLFHSEPFDPGGGWSLEGQGRLSSANGALPWIVFIRDRKKMERLFPHLRIVSIKPHSPLSYLASGGLSYPSFLPGWAYPLVKVVEILLFPFYYWLAYFQTIMLEKK